MLHVRHASGPSRRTRPAQITAIAALAASSPAWAQTATVRVVPSVNAVPLNTPMQIEVIVSWEGAPQLAGIRGDCVVQGNAGEASNIFSQVPATPFVLWGTPLGGSVRFTVISITPAFFTGGFIVPPSGNSNGLTILRYDLTFSEPGFYPINWVPPAAMPLVQLFPSTTSPASVNAPTTYIGAMVYAGGGPPPVICRPDLTTSATPGTQGYGQPNGVVSTEDFFYYLTRFAGGHILTCDMTHSSVPGSPGYGIPNFILNNDDFFFYLQAYSQGC